MKRLPVTVWSRVDKSGEAQFNHLEEGHSDTDTPTAKTEDQKKAWGKGEWEKKFGYLDDNCVVVEETEE